MRRAWTRGVLGALDIGFKDAREGDVGDGAVLMVGDRLGVVADEWRFDQDGCSRRDGLSEVVRLLAEFWNAGVPIVIHDSARQLAALDRSLDRYSLPRLVDHCVPAPVIDPMVLEWHQSGGERDGCTLRDLCAEYGVSLDGGDVYHRALAAVRVTQEILHSHPELAERPPADLDALLTLWQVESPAAGDAWPLPQRDPVLAEQRPPAMGDQE